VSARHVAWRQSSLKWTDIKSSNNFFKELLSGSSLDTPKGRKSARGGYKIMSGGKVFDYHIQEIFGEAIASPEAVGDEVRYQRGVFASTLHHQLFACIKASMRHSKGRIEATEFMRCECVFLSFQHGLYLVH
jgi:hypothetical protein